MLCALSGSDIVFQEDSGFCRDGILRLCQKPGIKYVVDLVSNIRPQEEIKSSLAMAKPRYLIRGTSERIFSRGDMENQIKAQKLDLFSDSLIFC